MTLLICARRPWMPPRKRTTTRRALPIRFSRLPNCRSVSTPCPLTIVETRKLKGHSLRRRCITSKKSLQTSSLIMRLMPRKSLLMTWPTHTKKRKIKRLPFWRTPFLLIRNCMIWPSIIFGTIGIRCMTSLLLGIPNMVAF